MTPLDDTRTESRPRFLAGLVAGQGLTTATDEIWAAVSADHRWTYQRVEVGATPWEATYLPTGQTVMHGSLPAARRWTAHEGGAFALANLRGGAQLVIDRRGDAGTTLMFNPGTPEATRAAARAREAAAAAERLALALRCAAVLDGLVVAGAPEVRCSGAGECGGYLAAAYAGERAAWMHADACRECIGQPLARRRQCRALDRHAPCGDPDPVLCEHLGCSAPSVYFVGQCRRGREGCCGCCEARDE